MNCHEARELLPLHLYGDLSGAERSAVDAHLSECPACRADLAALGDVRTALDAPIPTPPVDVAAIYRAVSERRSRRWRTAAILAIAASVLLLASRLEIRVDGRQFVVRWGDAESAAGPTVVERTVVVRPEPTASPELDERVKTMSALIQALAANMDRKDLEQQKELARLRQELASLQQIRKRLGQTERDVSALYTAQFGSRPSGANP